MPRVERACFAAVLLVVIGGSPSSASQVELISKSDPGLFSDTGAAGTSELYLARPSLSADGRYVAFVSRSPNLVAGQEDGNLDDDVFLHDRVSGTTVLVSRVNGTSATAGDGGSHSPVVSADGSFVAFVSSSSNLVSGQADFNGVSEVFLFDRTAGTVTLVSHAAGSPAAANGESSAPRISGDGSHVVFQSTAVDLVPGQIDVPFTSDVFLYDRLGGTTALLSGAGGSATQTANAGSSAPDLSADGAWITFISGATNLIPGVVDTNLRGDLFLHGGGTLTLVSHASGSPSTAANDMTIDARISADGKWVAFTSFAWNLLAGQAGSFQLDVFLYDRLAGATALVSRVAGSTTTDAGGCGQGQLEISADGAWIAFVSSASKLVAGQVTSSEPVSNDVFLYERATGSSVLVSHAANSVLKEGNGRSTVPSLSADGSRVAFVSLATDLVDGQTEGNVWEDVFLYDRAAGTVSLVSHAVGDPARTGNGFASLPTVSGDGSRIAFNSTATDLVSGTLDFNQGADLFLYDRAAATNALISRRDPGLPSISPSGTSRFVDMSAEGRFVTFASEAIHLVPGQVDANSASDVYLYDRQTGTTTLVSHAAGQPATAANRESYGGSVSADGRYIAWMSAATDVVPGQVDSNAGVFPGFDVFLYDRLTGTNVLVSHAAGSPVTTGNARCGAPVISRDGAYIGYSSRATNLVAGAADANGGEDIFLYDRAAGDTTLVSHAAGAPGTAAKFFSENPAFSGDGRFLIFRSRATDLVPGQVDTNNDNDLFLYELATGTSVLINHASGSATMAANRGSESAMASADAAWIVFDSLATDLVSGQVDGNFGYDVFLFERSSGKVTLVSHAGGSEVTAGNDDSFVSGLSSDGTRVLMCGYATDLVPGMIDGNGSSGDVFVHDRRTGTSRLASHARAATLRSGNAASYCGRVSGAGGYAVYTSAATDLVTAATDGNLTHDVFLYDLGTGSNRIVSRALGSPLLAGNRLSNLPQVSDDGGTIAFESFASDLAGGDFNTLSDVFVYRAGRPGHYYTAGPCRLLDTRDPGGQALAPGLTRILSLHGACGIPETARSAAVNVTVLQPAASGHLTLHAGDSLAPVTSTLSFSAGQVRSNNSILPLAGNGAGTLALTPSLAGNGGVHVVVDVVGWFE